MPEMSEIASQLPGAGLLALQEVTAEELRHGNWIIAYPASDQENVVAGKVVGVPQRDERMPGGWSSSIMVQPPPEIYVYPDDDPLGRTVVERVAPTVVIPPRLFHTMLYRAMDVRQGDEVHGNEHYRFFLDPSRRQPSPEA